MNTFGVQYPDKSLKISLEKYDAPQHSNSEISEIKKVLRQFQDGYTKRDLSNVEGFAEELFIVGDDTCILGTGTGELFKNKSALAGDKVLIIIAAIPWLCPCMAKSRPCHQSKALFYRKFSILFKMVLTELHEQLK